MKNLKKVSRQEAKQINGGAIAGCSRTRPCTIGWCCDGVCSPYMCPIID